MIHNWINTALIAFVAILVLVGGNPGQGGTRFPNGLSADSTAPAAGEVRGTTLTVTGAAGIDGDFDVDTSDLFIDISESEVGVGTTSPAEIFHVEDSAATSTAVISSGAASVGGRIILEDHDGAGCSEIAVLNGTLATKTVTCPSGI